MAITQPVENRETRQDGGGPTIAEVELRGVAIPYVRPIRWEGGVEAEAHFAVLRIRDSEGREGVAECTVKPTWNGFTIDTFALAFEALVLPILWAAGSDFASLPQRLGRLVENAAPKALLESALWDLGGAAMVRSVPESVPVSAVVTRGTVAAMAADSARLVEQYGFQTLKIKGGQGIDADIAAVRTVRGAVGPGVALYVDANGAVPDADAEAYVRRLAELGLIAIEDPYNLKPNGMLAAIQRDCPVPLIVDFSLDGVSSAQTFLGEGCGGISLKPSRFGMRKVLAMGAAAAGSDALTVIGLFGESQAGTVHLFDAHATLMGRARQLPVEATSPLLLTDHYLRAPIQIADGRMRRPEGRNIAAMVDPARLDHLTIAPPRRWTHPA